MLKEAAKPGIKTHVPRLEQPPTALAPLEEAPSILWQLLLAEALAQKPKGAMENSVRITAGQGKTDGSDFSSSSKALMVF